MEGPANEEEPSVPRLSLGGGNSDRPKRDEWSEEGVTRLLEAYESKWILRNRAKLKGQDWEDVAREVSSRADSTRSAKTATQCKNKIESMKKRYRNEVAAGSGSRWPLFAKLDGMVRCRGSAMSTALVMTDEKPTACEPVEVGAGAGAQALQSQSQSQSPKPNGIAGAEAVAQEHLIGGEGPQPTETNKDQNAPTCDSSKENQEDRKRKKEKRKRAKEDRWDVVESFQWLAEVILRVEQTRMEAMREVEKIRAEIEAKKGEMDLKRTEIIANTQLQIAKLFARSRDKVISSPGIGRE